MLVLPADCQLGSGCNPHPTCPKHCAGQFPAHSPPGQDAWVLYWEHVCLSFPEQSPAWAPSAF